MSVATNFSGITEENRLTSLEAWAIPTGLPLEMLSLIGFIVKYKGNHYYHLGTELLPEDSELKAIELNAECGITFDELQVEDENFDGRLENILTAGIENRVPRSLFLAKMAALVVHQEPTEAFYTDGKLDPAKVEAYAEDFVVGTEHPEANCWWYFSAVLDQLGCPKKSD